MKRPTKPAPKKARNRTADDWAPKLLARLAVSGNITDACRVASIDRTTFYDRRDSDRDFWLKAKAALAQATDTLELEARRRGADGVTRPVMHDGKPIFVWVDAQGRLVKPKTKGAKQVPLIEHDYSDTLLIFLLKAHRPRKYRERFQHEVTGKNGKPMEFRNLSDDEIDKRIADTEARLSAALGRKAAPAAPAKTA